MNEYVCDSTDSVLSGVQGFGFRVQGHLRGSSDVHARHRVLRTSIEAVE